MVDPQPVDEPVAHEREHELVGLLEHRLVLLADPGQVVDVEEAPRDPVGGSMSKNRSRSSGSAQ